MNPLSRLRRSYNSNSTPRAGTTLAYHDDHGARTDDRSWIDILWPMMGAASLMLGSIHLLIWFKQRGQWPHLVFSMIAALAGLLAIMELMSLRADTPQHYAALVRWGHIPFALATVLIVVFVHLRYRAGHVWLAMAACSLRLGCLLPNFLTGDNLNFRSVDSLRQLSIWGGETIPAPVGQPNLWMLLAQLSQLLLVVYLVCVIVTVWRRGSADERRSVAFVCGSLLLYVACVSIWTILLVLGVIIAPITVTTFFLGVVLVMGYELGNDVYRASELSRQLSSSQSRLHESEQRVQIAAEAGGMGMWTWNFERDDFWFSETGYALLGLTPTARIARQELSRMDHPDDRQTIQHAVERAIETGVYDCEYRRKQADGRFQWLSAKGRRDDDSTGTRGLIRGVLFDVTERRLADERFRTVVESAPYAILLIDADRRISLANAQAGHLFGYDRADLLGKSVDLLIPAYPRQHPVDLDRDGAVIRFSSTDPQSRLHARHKDSYQIPVEAWLTSIGIGNDRFVVASITDISERLRLEQQSALQRNELAHLSRVAVLGELSGSLAHELNQPLTAVLSNAQAALRFLQRDPPDLDEVHESLVQIVERTTSAPAT